RGLLLARYRQGRAAEVAGLWTNARATAREILSRSFFAFCQDAVIPARQPASLTGLFFKSDQVRDQVRLAGRRALAPGVWAQPRGSGYKGRISDADRLSLRSPGACLRFGSGRRSRPGDGQRNLHTAIHHWRDFGEHAADGFDEFEAGAGADL